MSSKRPSRGAGRPGAAPGGPAGRPSLVARAGRTWLLPAVFGVLLTAVVLIEPSLVVRLMLVVASLAALSAYFLGPLAIADLQLAREPVRTSGL